MSEKIFLVMMALGCVLAYPVVGANSNEVDINDK
jgi:hypothetical protein